MKLALTKLLNESAPPPGLILFLLPLFLFAYLIALIWDLAVEFFR